MKSVPYFIHQEAFVIQMRELFKQVMLFNEIAPTLRSEVWGKRHN